MIGYACEEVAKLISTFQHSRELYTHLITTDETLWVSCK